jgi:hypothetical protein
VSSSYSAATCHRALGLAASLLLSARASTAHAQISPAEAALIQNGIGARIEALTILGGDFGLSDGQFNSTYAVRPNLRANVDTDAIKFGGNGDVGDAEPLHDLNVGWQPVLQGNLGYLETTNHLQAPLRAGDTIDLNTHAMEFGGGVRLWTSQYLSFAPTLMVLYGHTDDTYSARSATGRQDFSELRQLGLVDWSVNTWSLRPALNVQYIVPLDRVLLTLSADATGFFTHGFARSNIHVRVGGNSGFVTNKIDVDVPLGIQIDGHELRSGGYLSRTDLFGDLRTGLDVQHLNELHGRVVLDFLNQVPGIQWVGIGASYIWGTNISGWSVGADVQFQF